MFIVIFEDGYEYEVERDDRNVFLRASKADRLRAELLNKAPIKRRRIETLNDHSESSSDESEDEEYLRELAERVCRIHLI